MLAFVTELEREVLQLQRELTSGSYRPGALRRFPIRDPKPRTIAVAPFRDRVVHHALIGAVEARLDAYQVPQSFACRRGGGPHAAVRRAQHLAKRSTWFAKLDVEHCFETLQHDVVRDTVARRLEPDQSCARLLDRILAVGGACEVGLPIGTLTSQHFANLVLARADRHLCERRRLGAFVRYMDDVILFAGDRATVSDHACALARYWGSLGLTEKGAARVVAPVSSGVPFLGFRVFSGAIRIDSARARRARRRWRRLRRSLRDGRTTPDAFAASTRSLFDWLAVARTLGLRRQMALHDPGE